MTTGDQLPSASAQYQPSGIVDSNAAVEAFASRASEEPMAEPRQHPVPLPKEVVTHHDRIPVYGHAYTICGVQSGPWDSSLTWDRMRVPNAFDAVCIPEGLTVSLTGASTPPAAVSGGSARTAPPDANSSRVAVPRGGVLESGSSIQTGLAAISNPPNVCLDLVIAGTLQAASFALRLRTLTVLPTGTLDLNDTGVVTFIDSLIDTTYDPSQYGHGLLCISGTLKFNGRPKTTWATLAADVHAGETVLQLQVAPEGWAAGDVLVLPDTRQPATGADLEDGARRIEYVTVANLTGGRVALTGPAQFDHLGWKNQQGQTELFPDVGNLTRSIVLQSENPNGTRAHVLITGRSTVSGRFAELRELGRTTVEPLDSTTTDAAGNVTHIGTNQIGRYPWHFHHCVGPAQTTDPYQFEATGLAVCGAQKWGIAVHGSHHGYVGFNVIDGAKGSGIVTETVSEYASVIESNLIIGRRGSGQRMTDRSHRNDPQGDFWHGSVGLGLTSATCTIRQNRIYNCKEGIGMAGFRTTPPEWPAFRGADPMTHAQPKRHVEPYFYPFDFPTNDNQIWGCWRGIETWTADTFEDKGDMFPGLTVVHTRTGTDLEDQQETVTKRWRFLGDFAQVGSGAVALAFKDGYEFGHTHFDAEFRGYDVAYRMVFPHDYSRFIRCMFECPVVVFQPLGHMLRFNRGWSGLWQECTFRDVNGGLTFMAGDYPKYGIDLWLTPHSPDRQFLQPTTYAIRPWWDGRNLNVYHWFQRSEWAAKAPITAPNAYGDFPPGVYSNAQLIARGTPIFGAVMPDDAKPFGPFFFASER